MMVLLHPPGLKHVWSDECGSELVEFSLCAVVIFSVLFGIMECSQALYVDHFLAYAAREATRYAMVRGSSWQGTPCATTSSFDCAATASNVTNLVISLAPAGVDTSNLTVTPTWPGTTPTGATCGNASTAVNSPGCVVQVNVRYALNFAIPFVPVSTVNLQSTSAVLILE